MKQQFTLMKPKFTLNILTSPGNDYVISGDYYGYEFQIIRRGYIVATISKKFFSISDCYGVEVDANQDIILILCCCIILDKVMIQMDTYLIV